MALHQQISRAVRIYLEAAEDSSAQDAAFRFLRHVVQQAAAATDDRLLRLAVFEGAADVDGISAAFARNLCERLFPA